MDMGIIATGTKKHEDNFLVLDKKCVINSKSAHYE